MDCRRLFYRRRLLHYPLIRDKGGGFFFFFSFLSIRFRFLHLNTFIALLYCFTHFEFCPAYIFEFFFFLLLASFVAYLPLHNQSSTSLFNKSFRMSPIQIKNIQFFFSFLYPSTPSSSCPTYLQARNNI